MKLNGKDFPNINGNSFKAELRKLGIKEEDLDLIDFSAMNSTNSLEELKNFVKDEYGIVESALNLSGEETKSLYAKWDAELKSWQEQNQAVIQEWTEKVSLPEQGIIIITGGRGQGKSCLGYYLLELAHLQNKRTAVFGLPSQKKHLAPPWVEIIENINDIPEQSVVFFDESALTFYARESFNKLNKLMNKLISISRQKSQILIFCSHTLSKLDRGICADVDVLLMKKPSLLHKRMERERLREMTEIAEEHLKYRSKEFVYCYSHNFEGVLTNPLPSFWSEELSCAWAGIRIVEQKPEEKGVWTKEGTSGSYKGVWAKEGKGGSYKGYNYIRG